MYFNSSQGYCAERIHNMTQKPDTPKLFNKLFKTLLILFGGDGVEEGVSPGCGDFGAIEK